MGARSGTTTIREYYCNSRQSIQKGGRGRAEMPDAHLACMKSVSLLLSSLLEASCGLLPLTHFRILCKEVSKCRLTQIIVSRVSAKVLLCLLNLQCVHLRELVPGTRPSRATREGTLDSCVTDW